MGLSISMGTGDEQLKEIETLAREEKISGPQAKRLLAQAMPLLRQRTRKLANLTEFVKAIADEDRLFVVAWKVWKRKLVVKGVPQWTRSEAPVTLGVVTKNVVAGVAGVASVEKDRG